MILHFHSFIGLTQSQLYTFIKFHELIITLLSRIFKHITLARQSTGPIIVEFLSALQIAAGIIIGDKINLFLLEIFCFAFLYYRRQQLRRIFRW